MITALWAVLAVLEIVLVGKLDPQETPVGAAIALLGTAVTLRAAALADVRYGMRLRWVWFSLLVLCNVVRDAFVVGGVVLRRLGGGDVHDAYLDVAFDTGGDDPESAARRALVIAGMSTAPNAVVLSVDRLRGALRVHVLAPASAAPHSREWPL
ncbi:MAG TPA: hypothetical protein VMD91_08265 [Candidatus Sulfotelmatobacter sp.]|nr:hypothetical protein [Candidatus Sulfotelmatobacter sp.]